MLIILYIIGYIIYNKSSSSPYMKHIELFNITDELLMNYKDREIYIIENIKELTRNPTIKTTTLGNYINNYIHKQDEYLWGTI